MLLNDDEEAPSRSPTSRCFPLNLTGRCPLAGAYAPSYCTKIHDLTHLILIITFFSSLYVSIHVIAVLCNELKGKNLTNLEYMWHILTASRLLVDLIFLIPITTYTLGLLGQYDDNLLAKERNLHETMEDLRSKYNALLSDMETLISNSAESHAALAGQNFESKMKDFQRFLEKAKSRYGCDFLDSKGDTDILLNQFRRFVLNWIAVFKECSRDPIRKPNEIVSKDALECRKNVQEVCQLCIDRLRVTEVRFITKQCEQDQLELRNTWKRRIPIDPEATRRLADKVARSYNRCFPKVSWFSCGCGKGCAYKTGEEGYPVEFNFMIGRFVVLSRTHIMLMANFLLGIGVLVVNVRLMFFPDEVMGQHRMPDLPGVLMLEASLLFILIHFESLDVIAKIKRQVRQLKSYTKQVRKKSGKMQEYWNNEQPLAELWYYRTATRLDLYKMIHNQLEDSPIKLLLPRMASVNDILEDLEGKLGTLQEWQDECITPKAKKKQFANEIAKVCQFEEFDDMFEKLEELCANGLEGLEGVEGSTFDSYWVP